MQTERGEDAEKRVAGIGRAAIETQLERVLTSDGFANSSRMSRFLRLAVEKALNGEAESLKEYVIGVEVFDKPLDFDPRVDSIVRVEARRLRRKLREYYQDAGRRDPVLITFPEGCYMPAFHERTQSIQGDGAPEAVVKQSIAVLPFSDIGGDEEERSFCDGLSEDLTSALTKIPGLRVASRRSTLHLRDGAVSLEEIGRSLSVELVLDGTVRGIGERVRVAVQLINVADGFNVWSETYERRRRDVLSVQAEVADAITRDLAAGPLRRA